LWAQVVPNWFVKQHVDALGDEIQFVREIRSGARHDFDIDLIYESGEFLEKRKPFGKRLFIFDS